MSDTKELDCVEMVLQADAKKHPNLEAIIARLNVGYKEALALMEKQSGKMHAMFAPHAPFQMDDDIDVNVLDARIEAVWNECFEALQRLVKT